MARVRIKICGVTSVEDADLAVRYGADAVGLNLYAGSKRHIASDLAAKIAGALPPFVAPIALMVNTSLAETLAVATLIGPTVQWHGDDPPLPPPPPWRFIPAFNIVDVNGLARITDYLARCAKADKRPAAILVDGHAPGHYGGTGLKAPWQLLADFDPGVPLILAGGLTPENVSEAIEIVRPFAVDVAGGVESASGRKDPDKVRQFIEAVHQACT